MPIYGECGGLLYLTRGITDGKSYKMCNVLPASSEMTKHVQALGYPTAGPMAILLYCSREP